MRLLLLLDRTKKSYAGSAETPSESWPIQVALDGDVAVDTSAPKDVADYVRRVVKIALREAEGSGRKPPLRIHRWRA